jgi:3-hydroxypropanoate dehydrogenase
MITTAEASCPPTDSRTGDLLFRNAHTAYSFTDQPVTDEQLEEIYDLVRYAPTAMNSQPLRITFLRTEAAKARLMPHLAAGNRRKSESAPVVAILAADTDFHENLARVLPQVPDARHRFADDDARVKSAMFNSALQAGYFVIAARAVGLDVGPMAGFDQAGLDAEFFAGTALRSFLVVNLGYVSESGNNPRNPRLAHHEAVSIL